MDKFISWTEVVAQLERGQTTTATVFSFIELFCELNRNGPLLAEIQAAVDLLHDKQNTKTSSSHVSTIIDKLEQEGLILTDKRNGHRIPGRIMVLK